METLNFFLSWTPIVLIMVLAVGLRRQALELALWGTIYTVCLVLLWFTTSPLVVLWAGLDGVLTNLPLLLVIYFGMLLSGLLTETGSLARVVSWFSTLTRNSWHSTLMISVGSGNFLEGAGIVAEPVVAPMLKASGLTATGAASLSIAGYSGLMMLELGGAILEVLTVVTGLESSVVGKDVALLSLFAVFPMVFSFPWLMGRREEFGKLLPLLLCTGLMAGGGALFAVYTLGTSISGLFGGLVVLAGFSLAGTRRWSYSMQLFRDMTPLLFLLVCLFSVNLIGPIKQAALTLWPCTLCVVPGHKISLRPLFSTYTVLLLSYLLAALLTGDRTKVLNNFLTTSQRAWRPVLAMLLFGVAGQIIAYSGFDPDFARVDPGRNIALTLANGIVLFSGKLYPLFAPLIGWIGTFLTGYGTASVVLFGKLQVTTGQLLSLSPSLLVSGMAVGSAVGSISSPLKVALAASMCGAQGREGEILKLTIPLGVGVSILLGGFLWLLVQTS